MTYFIVGKRILGIEFFYGIFSYFFIFFMHHKLLMLPGQPINFFFYLLSMYEAMLFLGLVRSNPGRLAAKHKRIINQSVSLQHLNSCSFTECKLKPRVETWSSITKQRRSFSRTTSFRWIRRVWIPQIRMSVNVLSTSPSLSTVRNAKSSSCLGCITVRYAVVVASATTTTAS
jgi:hypothetical protein